MLTTARPSVSTTSDRPRAPCVPCSSTHPKPTPLNTASPFDLAANWLANARSYNNEDRSWRVAGLAWAGTNKAATAASRQRTPCRAASRWRMVRPAHHAEHSLRHRQKPCCAPHCRSSRFQSGLSARSQMLLNTQQEDGSWYVQTRALGFQPWFDAGFPHGHNQWISAAGSNWAAMALAYALPESATQTASFSQRSSPRAKSSLPSDNRESAGPLTIAAAELEQSRH